MNNALDLDVEVLFHPSHLRVHALPPINHQLNCVSRRKPTTPSCPPRVLGHLALGSPDLPTPTHYRTCFGHDCREAPIIYDLGKVFVYRLDWVRRGGKGRQQHHRAMARGLTTFHPLSDLAPAHALHLHVIKCTNHEGALHYRHKAVRTGSGPGTADRPPITTPLLAPPPGSQRCTCTRLLLGSIPSGFLVVFEKPN